MTKKIPRREAFAAIDRLIDFVTDGLLEPLDPEIEKDIDVVTKWMSQQDGGPRVRVRTEDQFRSADRKP